MNHLQNIIVPIPLNLLNQLIEMLARNRGIDNFSHNQIQLAIESAARLSNESYQKFMMANGNQLSEKENSSEQQSE